MVGDGRWLAISEVVARFRDAGYPDSVNTIRRLFDQGAFTETYTADSGYRYVSAAAVDAYLAARRSARQ